MRMSRFIIGAALMLTFTASAGVFAIGAFFAAEGDKADVYAPGARVFVHRSGSREDMVLQVGFTGNASSFVWIIPVPSRPTVQYASASIFDELRSIMEPKILPKGAAAQLESRKEPKPVGLGDLAVIPPIEPDTMIRWIESSGYKVSSEARATLTDYYRQGWYFVVVRVKATPSADARWLQPLWISFDAPKAYLPMRLTSVNSNPLAVQLYVSAKVTVKAAGLTEAHVTTSPLRTKYKLNEFPVFFRMVSGDSHLTELRGMLDPKKLLTDMVLLPK